MASNEDNKALGIKAPELKAVPHEMYPGYECELYVKSITRT